jgi:hypothetical protein
MFALALQQLVAVNVLSMSFTSLQWWCRLC